MRSVKLTGRESAVVRVIGFGEGMIGTEIQENTHMDLEDCADTLNGLIAAGYVESLPYSEEVALAAMPLTSFEVNPAYVMQLKTAIHRH